MLERWEAGHPGVRGKVRACLAQAGESTGHLNEDLSWRRAARVRLLEAGDTEHFQRPARDLARNTSSVLSVGPGQVPGHREGQPGETRTELGMEARKRRSSRPQKALEPETKNPILKGCLEAQLIERSKGRRLRRTCLSLLCLLLPVFDRREAHWRARNSS